MGIYTITGIYTIMGIFTIMGIYTIKGSTIAGLNWDLGDMKSSVGEVVLLHRWYNE